MLYKVPKAPFLVNVLYLGGLLKIFPRILPIGFSGMYAAESQGIFLFLKSVSFKKTVEISSTYKICTEFPQSLIKTK